jgi:hypothetical protein
LVEIWTTHDRLKRDVVLLAKGVGHIRERHGSMADRLDEIRIAVEQPDLVTRAIDYERRENHYRRRPSGKAWTKVVVQYRPVPPQGTWRGEVITAFRVGNPDPEEEILTP